LKSVETMLSGRSGELLITVARSADQTTSSTQTTNQDSGQSVPLTNDSMGHKSQPLQNGNKPSTNLVSKNGIGAIFTFLAVQIRYSHRLQQLWPLLT